jgi:hypothetical protein
LAIEDLGDPEIAQIVLVLGQTRREDDGADVRRELDRQAANAASRPPLLLVVSKR